MIFVSEPTITTLLLLCLMSLFADGEKPAAVDALKRASELAPEDKGAKEAPREAGFLAD
jgi:hypothetical protein